VLDVAGGRGGVSFELLTRHGIPCTLVEPRAQKLSRVQHVYLRHVRKQMLAAPGADKEAVEAAIAARLAPQVQQRLDASLLAEQPAFFAGCSLLIGMHPDEATDCIVDTACALGKPFAVVPCCVFADVFTDRRVEGKPVRTYSDLVAYLTAKAHPQPVRRVCLPFVGQNTVVFAK
jgi:hypothetical protein